MLMAMLLAGKWKYLILGTAMVVLLYCVVQIPKTVKRVFRRYFRFFGTCKAVAPDGRIQVAFKDARGAHITAVYDPGETVKVGEEVIFAIKADLFRAGGYPRDFDAQEIEENSIMSGEKQVNWLLRELGKRLPVRILLAIGAFVLFLILVRRMFP